MKIENTEIAFLERSKKEAGLSYGTLETPNIIDKLGSAPAGSGHDNYLKGIMVAVTVTASQVWWLQWSRYHYHDIVSSTSKMHSILAGHYTYHPATDPVIIKQFEEQIADAKILLKAEGTLKRAITEALALTCPMGLELTAGIRTNYLQLKTVYSQRVGHILSEWGKYCDWIEELPEFVYLTQKDELSK